ncbi:hypothetical protein EAO71_20330 [Streptomyces sp. ms191]|uniref:DUF6907 domain-containing protein n=1 Tax=Streptomyces sp. ms191 TaxID=1827978 RepID=UPI0011CE6A13|nr:hypothetical protein [Streptomyces sp. ms191]TXS30743.1 hypothetical protein EAO71_20330 [Streptomyces sp. ms191]
MRTVTLPTTDHGDVTVPEPRWCTGHAVHRVGDRTGINHTGPEHRFAFGDSVLMIAMLSQYPCAEHASRDTGVYVEQTGYAATLDPTRLRHLAAALTVHAMHLRTLAEQLAAIEEAGR